MNATKDITSEVNDMIGQFLAGTGRCSTKHVVQAIVTAWSPPGGPDEDKWLHCGYGHVSQVVASAIKKYDIQEDGTDDRQLVLDGYEKLHRAYRVRGELIRVDKLTVADAMDVLAQLDRCESGIRIHRNEMQRYIDEVLIPRGNGN
jgi:hypothetical protein